MTVVNEFKKFALKGNMIDMAVGIVIGGAFSTVIQSIVADIITPPLALFTERVDFASLGWTLREASVGADGATTVEAVRIDVGSFLNSMISFLIIAVALFLVIRLMNRVREQFEAEPDTPDPTTKKCAACKMVVPLDATRCGHCTSAI